MGCKVILTPQSLADLEKIVTFIARDNPGRACTFGNELIDRALATATFPNLAAWYRRLANPPTGKRFYVLRFWHGARGEPEIKPAV